MECRDCGKLCGAEICVDCFLIQVKNTPSDPSRIKENRYSGVGIEYGVLAALFEMYPHSNVGLVAINAQTAFDEAKKFLDSLVHNQCSLAGCYSDGTRTKHTELCLLGKIELAHKRRATPPSMRPYVFDPEKCEDGKPHESIMGSEFCLKCGEPL